MVPSDTDRRWWCAAGLLLAAACLWGCRGAGAATGLPQRHSIRADQLLIQSDVRLPKGHPLLVDLERLRQDISTTLDLPVQEQTVTVYLFGDEKRYADYLQATYPHLPPRRAYFVGTARELAVYTFWGEKIQEDLRHEYTHGVLHACLKDVPLWLDEGLAEYFEVAEPPLGYNREYVARMSHLLANGWRPDLNRLEQLESVSQMQKADYFEAWAWVHFLLHESDDSRGVLLDYLRALRENPRPGRLSARLRSTIPHADERFLAYAATLGKTVATASAAERSQR
uniref:DUF1570 domain-containing protein n=1 Tax=Schlesneria paludicola TaxID=360056 RepID=A0A7C4LJN8_9PLAN